MAYKGRKDGFPHKVLACGEKKTRQPIIHCSASKAKTGV